MRRLPQQVPAFGPLSIPNWASRRWQTSSASAVATANEASQENTTSLTELQGKISALPPGTSAEEHVGQYHVLRPSLIPEAFQQLHNAFYSPKQGGRPQQQGEEGSGTEPQLPRNGGCKGLQLEMKVAGVFPLDTLSAGVDGQGAVTKDSWSAEENLQGPAVMWRECMQRLNNQLDNGPRKQRILLEGPAGSGKSISVATMVERCRAANWLVLYVPSATALTSGGYFVPRTTTSTPLGTQTSPDPNSPTSAAAVSSRKGTTYDTIFSAQHILLGMQQAHASQLAGLPLQRQKSRRLLRQAGWTLPSVQEVGQDGSSNSSSSSSRNSSSGGDGKGGYSSMGEQGAVGVGQALEAQVSGEARQAREAQESGEARQAHGVQAAGGTGRALETQEVGGAGQVAGAASGGKDSEEDSKADSEADSEQGSDNEESDDDGDDDNEVGSDDDSDTDDEEDKEEDSKAAAVTAAGAAGASLSNDPSSLVSGRSKGSSTEAGTLLDLVMAGLSTDINAALAVDACLALVSELDKIAEQRIAKVLFAIDNYNALSRNASTGYGTWEGADPELGGAGAAAQEGRLVRRQLRVDELTLARALRFLGLHGSVHHGVVLCATSSTAAPAMKGPQPEVLRGPKEVRRWQWPQFQEGEVGRALHHYYTQGALTKQPDRHLVNRMLALTNGNAAEIRRMLPEHSLLAGRRVFPVRYPLFPKPREHSLQQPSLASP